MTGIIFRQDEDDKNYIFERVVYEPKSVLYFEFKVISDKKSIKDRYFGFHLSGSDADEFYSTWTTHKQVYELLCDNLGVDYSVIPEDIEFNEKSVIKTIEQISKELSDKDLQIGMNSIYEEMKIRSLPIEIKIEDIKKELSNEDLQKGLLSLYEEMKVREMPVEIKDGSISFEEVRK